MVRFLFGRFYGEGDAGNGGGTEGGTPPPKKDEPKTFTQDEVNALLADNKRGLQQKLSDAQKQLDEARKGGANVAGLQKQIKELQDSLLTKEELAKQEAETLKTTYEQQLKTTQEAEKTWAGRYKQSIFTQELTKAAGKHDAFDPEQLAVLLERSSEVVETTDKEGKGTGQFKVMTKITLDGKELTLPIDEAVGKLRESGKYPNQFKVKGSPGTGLTLNNSPTPEIDSGKVPANMQEFMKVWEKLPANVRR